MTWAVAHAAANTARAVGCRGPTFMPRTRRATPTVVVRVARSVIHGAQQLSAPCWPLLGGIPGGKLGRNQGESGRLERVDGPPLKPAKLRKNPASTAPYVVSWIYASDPEVAGSNPAGRATHHLLPPPTPRSTASSPAFLTARARGGRILSGELAETHREGSRPPLLMPAFRTRVHSSGGYTL